MIRILIKEKYLIKISGSERSDRLSTSERRFLATVKCIYIILYESVHTPQAN